jgi:predicted GH43/DUF377 family glycosyl hydrolase
MDVKFPPCAVRSFLHQLSATLVFSLSSLAAAEIPDESYLFSYFLGNGESGLHLAWSSDGLKWEALNEGKSFLTPKVGKSKLMRDPCITRGPDGRFHMVWTDSWDSSTIGYASSADLIHWSEQKEIPVMSHEPEVKNCWAPEIAYDAEAGQFMIFWASTIPGRFSETETEGDDNNHRTYAVTTTDFESFSKAAVFFDPGFNSIDSTILPLDGKAYLFFKDETKTPRTMKNLRLAVADRMAGPYTLEVKPINLPGAWVEGPSALRVGGMTYLYFDAYTKHHYGLWISRDMCHWEDMTDKLTMPAGIRHGTAFAVPGKILKNLIELNP